ncbi:MAG: isoprenylcysteine carboxylmethyltransferase family protein [Candidatus Methanoperedens sp.]|nr:isoprenylcysteine carboxylmethyltransferase family protein [Candidatus Methanoperedens sp.]MCZ7371503.1 isoprenylcysteine carboxylmethyltransferase family protein [Candidatus Methanoperedens sp.]
MAEGTADLTKKAFFGLAQLVIILGVLLFVPAWSLDFWEAWVFLFIFSIAVLEIILYFIKNDPKLIEGRLKAGPSAEKERRQKIIQAFASLFFILLIVVPAIDHRFHWSHVPVNFVLVGDIFVLLGLLIVFIVFKANRYAAGVIEVGKEQKVISTGPYAIVRHPMYTGALLMLCFVSLALGSLWGLVFVFPMFVVIVLRLLDEEKFLSKNLPGYKEYRQKTRYRLVPFLW